MNAGSGAPLRTLQAVGKMPGFGPRNKMDKIGARRTGRMVAAVPQIGDASSLYAAGGARKYLNAEERSRVLTAIEELPRDQALFALTLAWSGARTSEALALTSSSFQIERGIVAIRTLKRRRHAVREVPLPPTLLIPTEVARHSGMISPAIPI